MSGDWIEYWNQGPPFFTTWHLKNVNENLIKFASVFFPDEKPVEGKTIFVPLCGKSVDMKWLYDQGLIVVGVEFAEKPIIEFFKECGMEYKVENHENYDVYISNDGHMKLFRSDLFILNDINYGGKFDYVWDRRSLVAINKGDKQKYANLMSNLMKENCVGLLEVLEFDPNLRDTTPHPLFKDDLLKLYGNNFVLEEIFRLPSNELDASFGDSVLYKLSR